MTGHVFRFEWTKAPLSLNYSNMHRMVKARITKEIRAEMALRAADLPRMGRCRVVLTWVVNDKRKRDEENPVPVLKALCDGLVDAGVVVDDVPAYMVKLMPVIRYAPKAVEVAHFEFEVTSLDDLTPTGAGE